MSGMKVAVIGAGSSGCCAAKNSLENGLEPTIFEKAKFPGGLWASCNDNRTAVWDGLYANISYFCMQFSDHPHTYGPSIIPSFKDISAYILSYIEKFKLDKYMRLSTQVNKVKYLPDKRWEVNSLNLITNESKTEIFDFLIVSSGLHASPRIPKFENMENFSGLTLHGSQFKLNDERLKGKKVVVLGHSYSATDISANCVGTASTVTNLFRRPYLVTPRLIRFKSEINKNKKNSFHVVPIDFLIFRRVSTLCDPQTPEAIKEFNRKHLMQINVEQSNKELSHPDLYYDFDEDEIRESISDNYYAFVKKGEVKPKKGNIKRFESDSIILEDDSVEKADVVNTFFLI
jgi:cation diffusion facilitator CzcD-associated flavoprotein CzcO